VTVQDQHDWSPSLSSDRPRRASVIDEFDSWNEIADMKGRVGRLVSHAFSFSTERPISRRSNRRQVNVTN
jgi:hypothetical protein